MRGKLSFVGIWVMVLAALAKSTVAALAKLVSAADTYDIPIFEVLFFILLFQLVPGTIKFVWKFFSPHDGNNNLNAANHVSVLPDARSRWFKLATNALYAFGSVCGALAIVCQFAAYSTMALGNASALFWTNPAIIFVVSVIFRHERCTTVKTICSLLSVLGCLLLVRPEVVFLEDPAHTDDHHSISRYLFHHSGIALLAAVLHSISLLIKRDEQKIGTSSFFVRATVGCAACVIWMLFDDTNRIVPPFIINYNNQSYITVLPWVAVFTAAMLYTAAILTEEEACIKEVISTVACVGALEVGFSVVWQIIMFKDYPDWTAAVGTALISASVILLVVHKAKQQQSERNETTTTTTTVPVLDADDVDDESFVHNRTSHTGQQQSDERQPLLS